MEKEQKDNTQRRGFILNQNTNILATPNLGHWLKQERKQSQDETASSTQFTGVNGDILFQERVDVNNDYNLDIFNIYCVCGHRLCEHYYYGGTYKPRWTFCTITKCGCSGFKYNYQVVENKQNGGKTEMAAIDTTGLNKVENIIWKPQNIGDGVRGILLSATQNIKYNNIEYRIKTKTGTITVFGTTVLNNLMASAPLNKEVAIIYKGEEDSKTAGHQPVQLWDVYY